MKGLSERQKTILIVCILLLLFGLYFTMLPQKESFEPSSYDINNDMFKQCPTTLIQDGSKFLLFNNNLPEEEGVNPLIMDTLDDYLEFLYWQRKQNINCPVLYLQSNINTQGQKEYRVVNNIEQPEGSNLTIKKSLAKNPPLVQLVDANRESNTYNVNQYPGFDPHNQNIGDHTPLDKIFSMKTNDGKSVSPMDPSWGGPQYTKNKMFNDFQERTNSNSTDFHPKYIYEQNKNKGYN